MRKRKRATKSGAPGQAASSPDLGLPLTPAQQQLDDALRAWRKAEAAKTGKPAFIVLSDAVIRNLAIAQPQSILELLTISGIGPNKADQFGAEITSICRELATVDARTSPRTAAELKAHPTRAVSRDLLPSSGIKERTSPIQQFGEPTETFHRTAPHPPTPPPRSLPTSKSSTPNSAPGAKPNPSASACRSFSSSAPRPAQHRAPSPAHHRPTANHLRHRPRQSREIRRQHPQHLRRLVVTRSVSLSSQASKTAKLEVRSSFRGR